MRENHEYKAAKEMQKVLMRRKDGIGKPTRPRSRHGFLQRAAPTSSSIGTMVQATDLATNQAENFTILGAWDSDPEKGIVSYLSPVAQSLLNRKVGDEVEFEIHGVTHRHRIEKIEAYKAGPSMAAGIVAGADI